jgi:hypothetical protein
MTLSAREEPFVMPQVIESMGDRLQDFQRVGPLCPSGAGVGQPVPRLDDSKMLKVSAFEKGDYSNISDGTIR